MKLTVDFYRGIKHAEVDISGISLVAGKNYQGKSSIANAFGAVLLGEPLPPFVLKKDATQIVNTNSGVGKVLLECEDGTSLIDYPLGKLTSGGSIPKCSFESAGMKSPVLIETERDKSIYFSELLKTNPTKSEFKKAVASANIDDESIDEIWNMVETLSWDGAYDRAKKKGAELKGAWKHVTSDQYGINKGEIWKPEGWEIGLETKKVEDFIKQITVLRKERDSAVSATAIDDEERKKLKSYVDGIASARLNAEEHQQVVDDSQEAYNKHITDVPSILTNDYQACPSCGDALKIEDGKIVVAKKLTKKQIDDSQKKYDKHRDAEKKLQEALSIANEGLGEAKMLLKECEDAVEKWNQSEKKSKGRSAQDIDADIEQIEWQKTMLESYQEARNVHNEIISLLEVVKALAPEGLRKSSLTSGILKFNKKMHELCREAEYGSMSIEPSDLSFTCNGRRYELLSDSEKYRLRAVIQVTIAIYDESDIIILDGVDILDGAGRSGLLILLNEVGKTALLCMTILDGKENMRDMSDVGGHSYWIEEGEVA